MKLNYSKAIVLTFFNLAFKRELEAQKVILTNNRVDINCQYTIRDIYQF